jgi:hypothetical protein
MDVPKLIFVETPCPKCADHPMRRVTIRRTDAESELDFGVYSPECGHFWNLPKGEASKIKKAS